MRTVGDPCVLSGLVTRLERIRPDTARRWGTLTAAEMLCHLGDAHEAVLGVRPPPRPSPTARQRPLLKWLALYTGIPWQRGASTRPGVDPKLAGTRPSEFERDRQRAIESLRRIASAEADALVPRHALFGRMTAWDWRRWAYRHVDHHLRQFGQ